MTATSEPRPGSLPALPEGAFRGDDWSATARAHRVIATRDRHVDATNASVWGDAMQLVDGRIMQPTVRLQSHWEDGLTPAQARLLAEELITAAAELEHLAAAANGEMR